MLSLPEHNVFDVKSFRYGILNVKVYVIKMCEFCFDQGTIQLEVPGQ